MRRAERTCQSAGRRGRGAAPGLVGLQRRGRRLQPLPAAGRLALQAVSVAVYAARAAHGADRRGSVAGLVVASARSGVGREAVSSEW